MSPQTKNITVSSGVTRIAGHLRVTPTMVDDFLIDPVMGIYWIFGVKLDVFQAYCTRITWWVPNVLDSGGFGTGKSFRVWLVTNLRAILIPGQQIVAYYQDFSAMKNIYWKNYRDFGGNRAPIFEAQKGRIDTHGEEEGGGKDNTRGNSCYIQNYKNQSAIFGPAPNWLQGAKGQAGLTFHVGVIDEWTKVESMTPKNTKLTGEDGNLIGGIDQQIIGRIRASGFNQNHMFWGNHYIFTATAESTMHPAYARYRQFEKEIESGNTNYAILHSCFKDFSNVRTETDIRVEDGKLKSRLGKPFKDVVPNWNAIKMLKGRSRAHFQREALGLWARDTRGFYSEDALARCIQHGIAAGTEVEVVRGGHENAHYFQGVDPAPAQSSRADDGAMSILRLRPKPGLGRPATSLTGDWLFEFVWSYRVRGESSKRALKSLDERDSAFYAQRAGDWSGLIHRKHQQFNLDGIMMDSQGGGQLIWPELNKARQRIDGVERACTPIATVGGGSVGNAHYILALFMKEYLETVWPAMYPGVDGLLTASHNSFQDAIAHGEILYPKPFKERPASETRLWTPEKRWALITLDTGRQQLVDVAIATKDNGEWDLTRNNCFRFKAGGKKDLAYSQLYAYVRALLWLKAGELEFAMGSSGDTYITGG